MSLTVNTIKTEVLDQLQRRLCELSAPSACRQRGLEVIPERPASNGKAGLQIAVLLLELVELVEVAQQLCAVAGDISRVGVLQISPLVGEKDLAGGAVNVCKSIGDLGEFVRW